MICVFNIRNSECEFLKSNFRLHNLETITQISESWRLNSDLILMTHELYIREHTKYIRGSVFLIRVKCT